MCLAGSGINHQEQATAANGEAVKGVTVLYFESSATWSGFINRLELSIPGVHTELLARVSQSKHN